MYFSILEMIIQCKLDIISNFKLLYIKPKEANYGSPLFKTVLCSIEIGAGILSLALTTFCPILLYSLRPT